MYPAAKCMRYNDSNDSGGNHSYEGRNDSDDNEGSEGSNGSDDREDSEGSNDNGGAITTLVTITMMITMAAKATMTVVQGNDGKE